MAEKLIAAALGGFLGWILTRAVSFFVLRHRLLKYLLATLNWHFENLRGCRAWLDSYAEIVFKEGHVINVAAEYTRDELSSLTAVQDRCLQLLFEKELVKLVSCTKTIWELEALFAGFCGSIASYRDNKKVLDSDSIEYLHKKADRIKSIIDRLPQRVERIKELPDDYRGVITPRALVSTTNATKPEILPHGASDKQVM